MHGDHENESKKNEKPQTSVLAHKVNMLELAEFKCQCIKLG